MKMTRAIRGAFLTRAPPASRSPTSNRCSWIIPRWAVKEYCIWTRSWTQGSIRGYDPSWTSRRTVARTSHEGTTTTCQTCKTLLIWITRWISSPPAVTSTMRYLRGRPSSTRTFHHQSQVRLRELLISIRSNRVTSWRPSTTLRQSWLRARSSTDTHISRFMVNSSPRRRRKRWGKPPSTQDKRNLDSSLHHLIILRHKDCSTSLSSSRPESWRPPHTSKEVEGHRSQKRNLDLATSCEC